MQRRLHQDRQKNDVRAGRGVARSVTGRLFAPSLGALRTASPWAARQAQCQAHITTRYTRGTNARGTDSRCYYEPRESTRRTSKLKKPGPHRGSSGFLVKQRRETCTETKHAADRLSRKQRGSDGSVQTADAAAHRKAPSEACAEEHERRDGPSHTR